jgi:hypothetical protein
MAHTEELTSFLAPYPPEVRALVLDGRQFLLDLLFPVNEFHYDATTAVCAGFGYTEKVREVFVNLAAFSKHVTLVFQWGARLDDSEKRLLGEGAQVRHIRLTKGVDTLRDPYVVELIRQAAGIAAHAPEPFNPTVIVKVYAGPKRRPKST